MTETKLFSLEPNVSNMPKTASVANNQDLPKDEDIFYRDESEFLPEGKTFDTLTEKELKELKNKYRFDYLRPGCYQGVTGLSKVVYK